MVPTQPVSPLHALVMKKKAPATKAGVQLKIVDKPIPVLQLQATKGFGGVPEPSMKKLYQQLKIDEPKMPDDSVDVEDVLAAGLIVALTPNVTPSMLHEAMSIRKSYDANPDCEDDVVPSEVLDDVMSASDRKEMTAYAQDLSKARAESKLRSKGVEQIVQRVAPKLAKIRSRRTRWSMR